MEVREIKFLFHDRALEYSFVDVTFSLPKEQVDKFEETIKTSGFDVAYESLPIHIVGTLNRDNLLSIHTPPDIFTIPSKEEIQKELEND